LQSIGVGLDGKMLSGSIYASGTVEDLANTLYSTASHLGIQLPNYPYFLDLVRNEMKSYILLHKGSIRPIRDAEQTLAVLKKLGLTLGVSTSDNEENTRICLEETGLLKYFRYIGCPGDSINPKPSGDILLNFGSQFGLIPEEIAVVGDTSVDIMFAKQNHAGLAIGVLSGVGKKVELIRQADYVLPTIAEMLQNDRPIWA
jgi:phosphoglycolate phosphatase